MADRPKIEVNHDTIDAAGSAIEKLVMDDLAELCWDNVSCARVLMNLRDRLDLMSDKLLDNTDYTSWTILKGIK